MPNFAIQSAPGIVTLEGEVDLEVTAQVADALRRARTDDPNVVVDLTAVTFIDSSGLNVLARAHHDGIDLTLEGVGPFVQRLLDVTGLTDVMNVLPASADQRR